MREDRPPGGLRRLHPKRRRPGSGQRSGHRHVPPRLLQRHDSFRALRRGLAEPEPADDGGLQQALLLLRVDLDALTVLAVGVGEYAGLPRSEAARSTNVLRVGDEVPRRQRQRPPRRGRAGPAALDDLGRLRRRRRPRRERALRVHRQRGSVRDQRHPAAQRHVRPARDAVVEEGPQPCQGGQLDLLVPERRDARRHRLGAGRPLPLRLGTDQHGDGDRRARAGLR